MRVTLFCLSIVICRNYCDAFVSAKQTVIVFVNYFFFSFSLQFQVLERGCFHDLAVSPRVTSLSPAKDDS